MSVLRFLFGHGWWIAWHVVFHAVLLVSVGMILAIFATELKAAGEKPDTPSPGSFMVILVALGLGALTFVDLLILARTWETGWWVRLLAAAAAAAAAATLLAPINVWLATRQSYPAFWVNLGLALLLIVANLTMLWFGETRPAASVPVAGTWLAGISAAVLAIALVALVVMMAKG